MRKSSNHSHATNMQPDSVIRNEGMRILIKYMGLLEAKRFVMLMQKEPFDYTKCQENLLEDLSIEEIGRNAEEYRLQKTR